MLVRYLILYVVALAGLAVGANVSSLGFLSPLSIAVLLLGAIGLWRLDQRPFRDLGFPESARWPGQLLISIALGIAIPLAVTAVLLLTDMATLEQRESANLPQNLLRALLVPAFIAASEEIIFRGSYFQVIKGGYGLVIGTVASAILWAIFHIPAMAGDGVEPLPIILGVVTFTLWGITLSLSSMLAGGSLWVPIGLHYGYNLAFSLLGALFISEIHGEPLVTGSSGWIPETGLIGVVVWSALTLLALWLARRASATSRS